MAEAQANPDTAGLRRPPAAPLFAATLAFFGGILLQTYCYKPAALYLLCTVGLMMCGAAALRYVCGARGARLVHCGAVLAFLPAGALLTAAPSLLKYSGGESVLDRIAGLWTEPYAGLFQAMVLSERGLVSHDERLEFQRSGTFHLLVVSGMNVAVFAVFLLWLMRWLRLRQEYAVISAGIRNPFHHPRPEVIERLAEHQAKTYRTDWFGPVTFYMDAAGVHPNVAR